MIKKPINRCKHEWKYWDEVDYPNGYEYEHVYIPHRRCKKCGRTYFCFDWYGECKARWRRLKECDL